MSWTRKHKKYSKPKKKHDQARTDAENVLMKKFGLKNKREIWKADSFITRIRGIAKSLITALPEKQEELLVKLKKIGFKVEKIADILALNEEDLLKRRLQSVLVEKQLAKTSKEARQLITHKRVSINDKKINIPGYIVPLNEEDKIKINRKIRAKEENPAGAENA
jgi:small subunit ribosomal protein S4